MTQQAWNDAHNKYASKDWINKPTIFAEWAIQYFPETGKVLDLGCGQENYLTLFR